MLNILTRLSRALSLIPRDPVYRERCAGQRSVNMSHLYTELPSPFFFSSLWVVITSSDHVPWLYYSLVYLVCFFYCARWSISDCLCGFEMPLRVLVGSLHQITKPCLPKARKVASQESAKSPRLKPKSSRPVAQKRAFRLVISLTHV